MYQNHALPVSPKICTPWPRGQWNGSYLFREQVKKIREKLCYFLSIKSLSKNKVVFLHNFWVCRVANTNLIDNIGRSDPFDLPTPVAQYDTETCCWQSGTLSPPYYGAHTFVSLKLLSSHSWATQPVNFTLFFCSKKWKANQVSIDHGRMSILHTSSIFEMIEEKKAQCHQFRCCPFHQTLAHRGLSQGCTNMNDPKNTRVHTLFHSSGLGTTGTMATRMGTPWLEISNHLVWRASSSTLRHVRHWTHQPPEPPRKALKWG